MPFGQSVSIDFTVCVICLACKHVMGNKWWKWHFEVSHLCQPEALHLCEGQLDQCWWQQGGQASACRQHLESPPAACEGPRRPSCWQSDGAPCCLAAEWWVEGCPLGSWQPWLGSDGCLYQVSAREAPSMACWPSCWEPAPLSSMPATLHRPGLPGPVAGLQPHLADCCSVCLAAQAAPRRCASHLPLIHRLPVQLPQV